MSHHLTFKVSLQLTKRYLASCYGQYRAPWWQTMLFIIHLCFYLLQWIFTLPFILVFNNSLFCQNKLKNNKFQPIVQILIYFNGERLYKNIYFEFFFKIYDKDKHLQVNINYEYVSIVMIQPNNTLWIKIYPVSNMLSSLTVSDSPPISALHW